jgi:predicted MFS family arabinose efflux permease
MSVALAVRSAAGALGPLLAPLTDRRGRRFGLTLGLGLFAAGALLAAAGPELAAFVAALVLMTLGKYVLDPAVLAHLSDLVPYERRGRVLAVTELSWSLAFFLGVPAAGFLIGRFGGRSPFLALAGLGLAGLVVVRTVLRLGPAADGVSGATTAPADPATSGYRGSYRAVLRSPAALAGIGVILAVSVSNELVNLVLGVWLEDSFGLKLAALGAAAAIIGAAEFAGEGLVVATVDRLGKTRALMIGLAANAAAALVLPLAGRTEAGALAGLAVFYLTFEYTVVSMLPVMSEVLPRARATLLAFYAAAFSLGRAAGSLLSAKLYGLGFGTVTLAAVALNAVAFLFLIRLHRLTDGAR